MPKICYVERKFSANILNEIERAIAITEEYAAQGYELTLRQLYYQFVARGWIANKQTEYKRLGDVINNARLAGLIDWDYLVDRTRGMEQNSHWDSPEEIIEAVSKQYMIDKWEGQEYRPEVWVEKEALAGIVERACRELDIPWLVCRGYNSQSEMWRGAMRLKSYKEDRDQTPYIIHLGDHDPSGIDMTRDIEERVALFCGFEVEVERIALNMPQVRQYNPPPNPAKIDDPRAGDYIRQHGQQSWELDALEPQVLVALIRRAVHGLRDPDTWEGRLSIEKTEKALLAKCSKYWDDVVRKLNRKED